MFLEHFGLKERPFGKSPDPKFLFLAPTHAEALARLEFGVEEREILLLTGEIGGGKTTLIRALVDRLGDKVTPVLIHNPRLTAPELLLAITRQLEIPEAPDALGRLERLQRRVLELHEHGRPLMLIVDEAQLLPEKAVFDELRLLTNFQLDDDNLLSVLLVGQPELRERLREPDLAALAQRIAVRHHLDPLDAAQTAELIRFRLETAGGDPALVTPEAAAAIHRFSSGIPRLINTLCALALLDAFGRDETRVGAASVRSAAEELGLAAPVPPRPLPPAAREPLPGLLRRRGRPPVKLALAPTPRKRGRKRPA